jgi:RecA/RadA recombinase
MVDIKKAIKLLEKPAEKLSTGWRNLNHLLQGGIPKKGITLLIGPAQSGKTTLALNIVATTQGANKLCAWVDEQHCFDETYAARIGVRRQELAVGQMHGQRACREQLLECVKVPRTELVVMDVFQRPDLLLRESVAGYYRHELGYLDELLDAARQHDTAVILNVPTETRARTSLRGACTAVFTPNVSRMADTILSLDGMASAHEIKAMLIKARYSKYVGCSATVSMKRRPR